ncbi:MAG: hypothetical protein PHO00_05075 [bacterium]|nr:hypothetical protein [bacterium]
MKCGYSGLIEKYFDGELGKSLEKKVSAHIRGCRLCEKQIEILKTLKSSLKSGTPLKAGENFTSGVMEKIENRFNRSWILDIKPLISKLVPAAAMVLLFLGLVYLSGLFEKKTVSLEEALFAADYTSDEKIVLYTENLSEYDVFRLTLE